MLLEHPSSEDIGVLLLTVNAAAGPWPPALHLSSPPQHAPASKGNVPPPAKKLEEYSGALSSSYPFFGVGIRRDSNDTTQHCPAGAAGCEGRWDHTCSSSTLSWDPSCNLFHAHRPPKGAKQVCKAQSCELSPSSGTSWSQTLPVLQKPC